jgi:uncharacterized pyridoxamine 5'-phosphate oxidase family protein
MTEPSFSEVYLKIFTKHNPHCLVQIEGDQLVVEKPWGLSDAQLKFNINELETISSLNSIRLNPRFDAIFHDDLNEIEIIYAFLDPNAEPSKALIDRKFDLNFEGQLYECYFSTPSTKMLKLACAFERLPSEPSLTSVPQMIPFRDYQRLGKLPEKVQGYFKDKVPRNFFIKANPLPHGAQLDRLVRHINFLLSYYDRSSPLIVINEREDDGLPEDRKQVRLIEGVFPPHLSVSPIDEIVLRLIAVARNNQPRFSFLYYYQVFEYAGYQYIDENIKKLLRHHLKDPALICCGEDKIAELFAIFSEANHNDDVKMKKVIEEYCDPFVIWKEIENDKEFFSSEHAFHGGFELKALIAPDTTASTWKAMWMPKLYDHLTKIRNSLVHARERRENKVILPGKANNKLLGHYVPVIARVAEQIALKT